MYVLIAPIFNKLTIINTFLGISFTAFYINLPKYVENNDKILFVSLYKIETSLHWIWWNLQMLNSWTFKMSDTEFYPNRGGGEDVENVGNKSLTPLSII